MITASTTREDIKDRIGQAYSEITIEQLIKVYSIYRRFVKYYSEECLCDYAYNKKVNISNILN